MLAVPLTSTGPFNTAFTPGLVMTADGLGQRGGGGVGVGVGSKVGRTAIGGVGGLGGVGIGVGVGLGVGVGVGKGRTLAEGSGVG